MAIPWRPTPDRQAAFGAVRAFYAEHLPEAMIVTGDAGGSLFSRAGSRNVAVDLATEAGAAVLVVADADTIPEAASLHAAIDACDDYRLHYAYDRFAYLDETETADFLAAGQRPDRGLPHNSSVMVCRPRVWEAVGGQDTRFDGWGGEDDAFFLAVNTLIGPPVWHPGLAVSLWHTPCRDVGSERWSPNGALAARYAAASGDPTRMQLLLDERTTP